MGRFDHATRVLELLVLLMQRRAVGMTVAEIQQELKVSRRTVYRDVECIKAAGIEVRSVPVDGGMRMKVTAVPWG